MIRDTRFHAWTMHSSTWKSHSIASHLVFFGIQRNTPKQPNRAFYNQVTDRRCEADFPIPTQGHFLVAIITRSSLCADFA
jgi:hypothetical protein